MRILVNSLILLCLIACQVKNGFLKIGKITKSEIEPPDVHRYKVDLKRNDFCALVVQQKGIDLMIRLIGPDGDILRDFDSPNGRWGAEFVSHFAEAGGIYTVEIRPLNEDRSKGQYSLELLKKEPKGTTPEKQVDQLFASWDRSGSPGAAVSIAREGEILYSNGYGYANLEYDIPITSSTIFHIASVSKQFTAFSIAMLADQGKLSLDDDIHKYLPELNDFGETITIRHLIYHISGLRDQWNLLAMAGWRLDDVITRDQILRLISRQKDLNFKPGDEMVYCNTGYTLLAEIVSRVAGKPFSEWTSENIFTPLNMDHTLFYDDHEKIVPGRAYSYQEGDRGLKKSVLNYANVGATSLFTTVDDIQHWADNFRTMKVGDERIMEMMDQRGVLNNGDTLDYAFGQSYGKYKGLPTRAHSGGDAGYRTYLLRFPDQGYSISVFSNLGSCNPVRLAYEVADIYLKEELQEEEGESSAEDEGQADEVDKEKTVEVPDSLLQEYSGRYIIMEQVIVDIRNEDGQLVAQIRNDPTVNMIVRSDTVFYIQEGDATIIFKRDPEGEVDGFRLLQDGEELEVPKLPPFDPAQVDLQEFTGTFYSDELQTAYTFKVEDDTLTASHQRHDPFKLGPLREDEFWGDAWFFGNVQFTRDQNGFVNGCLVSSGRVRDVYFSILPRGQKYLHLCP
jgi:CubicO group peptidase (beta-lactamase class C family)